MDRCWGDAARRTPSPQQTAALESHRSRSAGQHDQTAQRSRKRAPNARRLPRIRSLSFQAASQFRWVLSSRLYLACRKQSLPSARAYAACLHRSSAGTLRLQGALTSARNGAHPLKRAAETSLLQRCAPGGIHQQAVRQSPGVLTVAEEHESRVRIHCIWAKQTCSRRLAASSPPSSMNCNGDCAPIGLSDVQRRRSHLAYPRGLTIILNAQ